MSGLTWTKDPTMYGDFSINNLASRNQFQLVTGFLTYDAASCSALTVTANALGFTWLYGLFVMPKDNVLWQFFPSGSVGTLQPIPGVISSVSGTTADLFVPTASWDVASVTSLPFLAWGYR